MKRRRRYFRGIVVAVSDCTHEVVIPTSWWRLTSALVAVIVGEHVRRGVWCQVCRALMMPARVLRTCRLEDGSPGGQR